MGCCVRSVSKKMFDVLSVGRGSRVQTLEEFGFLGRGGDWEKLCLNQICRPPLLKKQNPRGKREALLDTFPKPLIIG